MKNHWYFVLISILIVSNCSNNNDDGTNQTHIPCDDPEPFLLTSLSAGSKLFKWQDSSESNSYTIRHGVIGFDVTDDNTNTSQTLSTNEKNIVINYETSIGARELYIRSNCTSLVSSDWIGPLNFFTNGSACGASTISITPIENTSIFLNWGVTWITSFSANSWNIEFGLAGFELGSGTSILTTNSNSGYTIENLIPSTEYDFYIKGNCRNGGTSIFTGFISYTTPD